MDPRGFPTTLPDFQRVFPDPQACATYLEKLRWPDGFACPKCGVLAEPYRFAARPHVLRCRSCQSDVSLTAATVMDHTHTPLSTWFWAAYLVTTQTPGQSAVQFQRQLGLSRYETAYQILHKLRAGMVRPDRDTIGTEHPVEVDECLVGGKTKGEGRGVHHKALVIGAVEVRPRKAKEPELPGGRPTKRSIYAGRLRLQVIRDRKAPSCQEFVRDNVTAGARVKTDGWTGYDNLTTMGYSHDGVTLEGDGAKTDEHLPMIHIVFSNLKSWILGTHHGISAKHLQSYLNEYTFRFNRRFYPMTAFNSVLGLAVKTVPPTYESLYSGVWVHPGGQPQSPQIEMPFA
jgi:transposase-like protein